MMSQLKKSKTTQSILDEYRKSKGKTNATLSQKVMEITKAGKPGLSYPMVCILCDANDICDPCDWRDMSCIFEDSCDLADVPEV